MLKSKQYSLSHDVNMELLAKECSYLIIKITSGFLKMKFKNIIIKKNSLLFLFLYHLRLLDVMYHLKTFIMFSN